MTGQHPETIGRNLRMAEMYAQGITLAKIGIQFDVTRERVRQILRRDGVMAADGGCYKTARIRRTKIKQNQEARYQLKYGISFALYRQLRSERITRVFYEQKRNANWRGIGWNLTLGEWFSIWQASGKIHLRGRGRGRYVMSRFGDEGPYELGNVHIQLSTDNNREGVQKSHRTIAARRNQFAPVAQPA